MSVKSKLIRMTDTQPLPWSNSDEHDHLLLLLLVTKSSSDGSAGMDGSNDGVFVLVNKLDTLTNQFSKTNVFKLWVGLDVLEHLEVLWGDVGGLHFK